MAEEGRGHLPLEAGPDGNAPRSWGDTAGWVNIQAYAGDLLFLAKGFGMIRSACL